MKDEFEGGFVTKCVFPITYFRHRCVGFSMLLQMSLIIKLNLLLNILSMIAFYCLDNRLWPKRSSLNERDKKILKTKNMMSNPRMKSLFYRKLTFYDTEKSQHFFHLILLYILFTAYYIKITLLIRK